MKTNKAIGVILVMLIAGCATKPEKLPTTYVSPLLYKDYDCGQMVVEMDNISRRKGELFGQLKKTASNDSGQMALGLLLWPSLFFLEGGDGPAATEYSRLKGEYSALEKAMVVKKCSIGSSHPSLEETEEK